MKDNEPVNDPLPKRGRGRPRLPESEKKRRAKIKTTKAKSDILYKTQNQIHLVVPQLPLFWRARKQLWLLQNIEKHLEQDPTYISPKEYFSLLKDMEAIYTELEKAGQGTNEQRRNARKGIQSKRLAVDGDETRSSRVGKDKSASVGDGVSTVNPFGGKR